MYLLTLLIKKLFTTKNNFVIYIYETVLFNTSEHNLSKSSYLFELTGVINIKFH